MTRSTTEIAGPVPKSVELHEVAKSYGTHSVLKGIDLVIDRGEFVVMVGPSGCGKSTLLKSIAGLASLTSGRILINGRDVTREEPGDRGIAMVFQSYALYPHMTVAENMGFGLRMAKRPRAEIDAAVERAARILRITDQLDKRPRQLSGGQRQRVAIGRAITRSPEVFLFDEPLSNLDASLRTQMRVELSGLHAELGSTMIYVTHDQVEAMTMASRIVILNAGLVEQVGAPLELYANPRNLFVAGFLGAPRMNFFQAKVDAVAPDSVALQVLDAEKTLSLPAVDTGSLSIGETLTVGIRPEHLAPLEGSAPDRVELPATVRLVEHLGRETILYADASPLTTIGSESGTGTFTVQVNAIVSYDHGAPIRIGFAPSSAYLFARDGRTLSPRRTAGRAGSLT
jgi:multiple sugar transport system ATP-binding protein